MMNSELRIKALPVSIVASRLLSEMVVQNFYPILQQFISYMKVEAGTYLWREGDASDSLALILSGRLEALKETEFPNHPFVTGIFNSGTVVGEDGFIDNLPRNTSAKIIESCDLLIMSRNNFERLEKLHPAIANLILKGLLDLTSKRLHQTQKRLAMIF